MLQITTLRFSPSQYLLFSLTPRMKLDVGKVLQARVLDDVSWGKRKMGGILPFGRQELLQWWGSGWVGI